MAAWCRRSRRARIWTHLPRLVARVMAEAGLEYRDLAGVAATAGPGLIGGLIVGSQLGKGIALAHGLPFVAVNHLEAHALTATLPGIVEGGGGASPTCCCCSRAGIANASRSRASAATARLGTTLDDAVGEAFDKSAKLLGLPWPGGPALERLAAGGATRPASRCRGRCWAGPAATSPCPG